MKSLYDVIVVGAGPAGCMAAKVIAENGFNVALLDMKENIAEIARACSQSFIVRFMQPQAQWNEIRYFNTKNKRFVFPKMGFTVKYEGPYDEYHSLWLYSPNMKSIKFGNLENPKPFGYVIDKSTLIGSILRDAEENGAKIFTERIVEDVAKTEMGAKVLARTTKGEEEFFEGKFVIAADGINSRIVDRLGFNKDRELYAVESIKMALIKGAEIPSKQTFKKIQGGRVSPSGFTMTVNTFDPEIDIVLALILANYKDQSADETLDYFLWKSNFAEKWFKNIEVIEEHRAVSFIRPPIEEPYKDNVLCIGDSSIIVEVQNAGALMCGWKAGNVISTAIWENKLTKEGIQEYLDWWKKSFVKGRDPGTYFTWSHCLSNFFTEEEINYIHGLLADEEFSTASSCWQPIFEALDRKNPIIEREKPELLPKIKKFKISKPLDILPPPP